MSTTYDRFYRIPNIRIVQGTSNFAPHVDYVVQYSTTGSKNVGWKSKIAAGIDVSSTYLRTAVEVLAAKQYSIGYYLAYFAGGEWQVERRWTSSGYELNLASVNADSAFGSTATLSNGAEAYALNKLYGKIRDESSGTNGLLILGELRETIQLIRNPLASLESLTKTYLNQLTSKQKQIRKGLKQRKGESRAAFEYRGEQLLLKSMSSSWLALQFGAIPVISDVEDICKTALDIIEGSHKRKRVTATSKEETHVSYPYGTDGPTESNLSKGIRLSLRANKKTTISVRYTCGLRHAVTAPSAGLEDLGNAFGFRIENFLPTVYELIPWSFLVDYFVNAGQILEAACTDLSSVLWTIRSERKTTISRYFGNFVLHDPYEGTEKYRQELTGDTSFFRTFRHVVFQRTLPGTPPLPPLVLSVPGTDSTKWYNMGALIGAARTKTLWRHNANS